MPAMLNRLAEQGFAFDYDGARLTPEGDGIVVLRTLPRPPEERTYSAETIRGAVAISGPRPKGEEPSSVLPEHRQKWLAMLAAYERLRAAEAHDAPPSAQTPPATNGDNAAPAEYAAGRKRRGRSPGSGRKRAAAA